MARKLFIKRETYELNILTRPRLKKKGFCEECQANTRWLFPEEVMALVGSSLREIFRQVESREMHFVESEEGFLLVCAESLQKAQVHFKS